MPLIQEVYRHPEYMDDSLHETVRLQIIELQQRAMNYVTTVAPAIVIGTTSAADIRINTAIDYVRNGERRTQKAAAEIDVPAAATMADDGTNREVVVLVYIDTSDNYAAVAGPIARNGAEASIPLLPPDCVQLGTLRIQAAAGTAYTANSTLLSAAGITDDFENNLVPFQNMRAPQRAGYM